LGSASNQRPETCQMRSCMLCSCSMSRWLSNEDSCRLCVTCQYAGKTQPLLLAPGLKRILPVPSVSLHISGAHSHPAHHINLIPSLHAMCRLVLTCGRWVHEKLSHCYHKVFFVKCDFSFPPSSTPYQLAINSSQFFPQSPCCGTSGIVCSGTTWGLFHK
jgi:hypothetical protein